MTALVSACASLPPLPANMPAQLTNAELAADSSVPYSDVIRSAGDVTLASGSAKRGDMIAKIPYRYRYTAVLVQDVKGFSMTVPGILAPAGAPGYFAGAYRWMRGGAQINPQQQELWCFLPKVVGGKRDDICLLRNPGSLAAIAPTRLNPYLWTDFSPATGTFDWAETPVFERKEIDIPADLTLEYRFEGGDYKTMRFSEYAAGKKVTTRVWAREPDGTTKLKTVAGIFIVTPDANLQSVTVARGAEVAGAGS